MISSCSLIDHVHPSAATSRALRRSVANLNFLATLDSKRGRSAFTISKIILHLLKFLHILHISPAKQGRDESPTVNNNYSGAFVRLQNSILYDEVDFRGVSEVDILIIASKSIIFSRHMWLSTVSLRGELSCKNPLLGFNMYIRLLLLLIPNMIRSPLTCARVAAEYTQRSATLTSKLESPATSWLWMRFLRRTLGV